MRSRAGLAVQTLGISSSWLLATQAPLQRELASLAREAHRLAGEENVVLEWEF
jgi:hypothetical protein